MLGLLGYYLASYLDFVGLQHVSAALERLILYLCPTFVLLLSVVFLGKRLTRIDLLALALAYGASSPPSGTTRASTGDNVALVLGSALSYAIYLAWAGELVQRLGAIRLTSYAMLVSTAAVTVQLVVLDPVAAVMQPAPVCWLSLLNALLCTVLPVFATMLAVGALRRGQHGDGVDDRPDLDHPARVGLPGRGRDRVAGGGHGARARGHLRAVTQGAGRGPALSTTSPRGRRLSQYNRAP